MGHPKSSTTEPAFELLVKSFTPEKKQYRVICEKLLRNVPGKRSVYEGIWQRQTVIIKIFNYRIGAKGRILKEFNGLGELQKRSINVPEPHFYGRSDKGDWVMVIEKICNSPTALQLYRQASSTDRKIEIVALLFDELAKLNNAGVIQTDLHMGNFLIRDNTVFSLDAGRMKFYSAPISRAAGIKQLALLSRYIPEESRFQAETSFNRYFNLRGWKFDDADKISAEKHLKNHIKKTVRKGLKKSLRTSTRRIKIQRKGCQAVFERDFYSKINVELLLKNIDSLMQNGRILKNGRTCFVSVFDLAGVRIAAKRYNHKGFFHSARHTIKRSRARRAWLKGHLLIMLGIRTPKPIAFIESYKAVFVQQSYILTEYVAGKNLHYFLTEENPGEDKRNQITKELTDILKKMHNNKITHGDLKKSNILITENGVCITDLDAMGKHRSDWLFAHRKNKDMTELQQLCSELS